MVDRVISATIGALLIVLGLRRLFITRDPDASLPRWMESVSSITPARAFGIGMVLFPIQIKNLAIFTACINLIATASFRTQESIVALVLALLIFAIPVLVLIGLYAAMPQRTSNMLGSLRAWMKKNNRPITVVLCLVFGAFFLVRGFSGP
jgi:Sap, sulfolipid-1-addressing protein